MDANNEAAQGSDAAESAMPVSVYRWSRVKPARRTAAAVRRPLRLARLVFRSFFGGCVP